MESSAPEVTAVVTVATPTFVSDLTGISLDEGDKTSKKVRVVRKTPAGRAGVQARAAASSSSDPSSALDIDEGEESLGSSDKVVIASEPAKKAQHKPQQAISQGEACIKQRLVDSLDLRGSLLPVEIEAQKQELQARLKFTPFPDASQSPRLYFYQVEEPDAFVVKGTYGKCFTFTDRFSCGAGHVEADAACAIRLGRGADTEVDFSFLEPATTSVSCYVEPARQDAEAKYLFSQQQHAQWFAERGRVYLENSPCNNVFARFRRDKPWQPGDSGLPITFTKKVAGGPHYLGYMVIARRKGDERLALAISLPRLLACPFVRLLDDLKAKRNPLDAEMALVLGYLQAYLTERESCGDDWELITEVAAWVDEEMKLFPDNLKADLDQYCTTDEFDVSKVRNLRQKLTETPDYQRKYLVAKQKQREYLDEPEEIPYASGRLELALPQSLTQLPTSKYDEHIIRMISTGTKGKRWEILRKALVFAECLNAEGKLETDACWFLRYNSGTFYSLMYEFQALGKDDEDFPLDCPDKPRKGVIPFATMRPYRCWPYSTKPLSIMDSDHFDQELKKELLKPTHAILNICHHPQLCERNPHAYFGSLSKKGLEDKRRKAGEKQEPKKAETQKGTAKKEKESSNSQKSPKPSENDKPEVASNAGGTTAKPTTKNDSNRHACFRPSHLHKMTAAVNRFCEYLQHVDSLPEVFPKVSAPHTPSSSGEAALPLSAVQSNTATSSGEAALPLSAVQSNTAGSVAEGSSILKQPIAKKSATLAFSDVGVHSPAPNQKTGDADGISGASASPPTDQ
ncbi:uncharacterized protein EV422DRAFT_333779 [Fimicolochytrium jonesii]|uniref:uncharacterized protein n=1 Tax=Fimicolochytrium jonesii TaxID=1396493 RepID=UPI0022FDDCAE|nr:uncharacterized protein EV422DRAFT_333779 [Fimicolochytrium jonesii]KAI8816107.1 hypothetical protein EV422DRAFT_333779 [Fimicolochytrium jonesii]